MIEAQTQFIEIVCCSLHKLNQQFYGFMVFFFFFSELDELTCLKVTLDSTEQSGDDSNSEIAINQG